MLPETFSTQSVRWQDQHEAWRERFRPVFEVTARDPGAGSFPAQNMIWKLDDLVVSRVSAPGVRVQRTPGHVRRNPIDHWVLSYCQRGETSIRTQRGTFHARPAVPFLWSLGEASETERTDTDRLQLFLSRDVFRDIAPVLDAAHGSVLDTPLGRLLGDFMLSLEHRLQGLAMADVPRLTAAVRALIAACAAPSAERIANAKSQIDLGRLERVRQTVRTNLRSSKLGPDMLCRAVGMSRSNLYRLLESEGGVGRYIQRQRLLEARTTLSDPKNTRSISAIANELCFAGPSSFGRAFRTTFGHSASETRSAALAGMTLSRPRGELMAPDQPTFEASLRRF
jgi:AraC-like DNA-binding protein